jgi:hypothetical protein
VAALDTIAARSGGTEGSSTSSRFNLQSLGSF